MFSAIPTMFVTNAWICIVVKKILHNLALLCNGCKGQDSLPKIHNSREIARNFKIVPFIIKPGSSKVVDI